MKLCTVCKLEKSLSEFYKDKHAKDGYCFNCKSCSYIKERISLNKRPWYRHLQAARQRCNDKNSVGYKNYGDRGITCELKIKEIRELWIRDRAYEMSEPSIDRIDNDGNYTFNNCQFLELDDNIRKQKFKKIQQFDKNGNFIKDWNSIDEASKKLKIGRSNISSVLINYSKSAGGFMWRYANNETYISPYNHETIKPILQFNLNGKFIKEWENQKVAGIYLNVDSSNINRAVNGKLKTSAGFIWKFKN